MEEKNIEAYVKYNTFDKEQGILKSKRKKANKGFHRDRLHYSEERDRYTCPMGQPMEKAGTRRRRTKTGHLQTSSLYQAGNCDGCPLWGA